MKLHDLFPGSFRASHFTEGEATFTIKAIVGVIFEEDGEAKHKGKMTFDEVENYWIFGKEAAGELALQGGEETDEWVGLEITLRKDVTRFKGEIVPCVRASFPGLPSAAPALIEASKVREGDVEELERALEEARAKKARTVKAPARKKSAKKRAKKARAR